MLDMTATLRVAAGCRFVTLTYSDDTIAWDGRQAKAHLRALNERMRRDAPEAAAVWRMELKPRLSGKFELHEVPHFHLLVFNAQKLELPDEANRHYTGWFNDAWSDIIGHYDHYPNDKKHDLRTDDVSIVDERHAMYYVSKYAAKCDSTALHLVTVPYPHAGRFWGVHNRKNLPVCDRHNISAYVSESVFRLFKAACVSQWPKIAEMRSSRGFTLYVDDAQEWHELLLWLMHVFGRDEKASSMCYNPIRRID